MGDEQQVSFVADGNRLEGMLAVPAGAGEAVVVCHPHPLYGGTMDNAVVRTVAAHLQRVGVATLRFNFRGVGGSRGGHGDVIGECADARAALALLGARAGVRTVTLAGYSFGAVIALRVGCDHPLVDRLVAIAPPLAMFALDFLSDCRKPKLLVAGDRDEYCPQDQFSQIVDELADPKVAECVAGADHFLFGFEDDVGTHVVRFLSAYGTERH